MALELIVIVEKDGVGILVMICVAINGAGVNDDCRNRWRWG